MLERMQMLLLDGWWKRMKLRERQVVWMMVDMLRRAREGDVLEVWRIADELKLEVVKRPEVKEPDTATQDRSFDNGCSHGLN